MFQSLLKWYIQHLINKLGARSDRLAVRPEKRLLWLGKCAIPELVLAVTHPNPTVRFRAVWVLGKSRDSTTFEAILSRVDDDDHRVAYDAIMALGELGDIRAVPYLQSLAEQRTNQPEALDSAAKSALSKLRVEAHTDT